MDTLGKRIRFIRERLKFNQSELAQYLGLESAVAISKYESDQREPDKDKLIKISKLGNTSLDWLLTGEGEMGWGEKEGLLLAETADIYKVRDTELSEIIRLLKEHPQDKKLVLKLLKGKKDIKEALEGFGVKKFIEEV